MNTFYYSAVRSDDPEHQVPGLKITTAMTSGQQEFANAEAAFQFATQFCLFSGHWKINVRNLSRRGKPWEKERIVNVAQCPPSM